MFIDTIHPQPNGAELNVLFEVANPFRARCVTRDVEPGWGMGVEFVGLEQGDQVRLRELLALCR